MSPATQARRAFDAGDLPRAERCARRAIRASENVVQMHLLLGAIALRRGDPGQAGKAFRTVTELAPELAAGYTNLGLAHAMQEAYAAAVDVLRQAHALAPGDVSAALNLALALGHDGAREESRERLAGLYAACPDDAAIAGNYARALFAVGDAAAAYDVVAQASARHPRYTPVRQMAAYYANFLPGHSARDIRQAHEAMNRDLYPTAAATGGAQPRAPRGQLRLGYMCGDFKEHSVAYFLRTLFLHHDRERMRVGAISTSSFHDDVTAWFKRHADDWLDISRDEDPQAASKLASLDLDVLIDVSGNTVGGRPALLARRPARCVVTYLGYPTTSGFDAVDFRISDNHIDPPGSEGMNSERLLRLPGSMFCYTPPEDAPGPPAAMPLLRNGHVTFGCFNKLAKASPPVREAWFRILAEVPDSVLVIKADELADPRTRERFLEHAAAAGIESPRLVLLPRDTDLAAHFARYENIDIALDTWPYNGATTTCEALMMGVPVVTWRGDTHASRMGASILSGAGLPGLIAGSADDYVNEAVGLAENHGELGRIREQLRSTWPRCMRIDGAACTRAFEALLFDALTAPPRPVNDTV